MNCKNLVIIMIMLLNANLPAQLLSGSASITLKGPASNEQTESVRLLSRQKIKSQVSEWLEQNINVQFDTLNPLHNYVLKEFVDTCLNRTKEETSFLGKTLTMTYILTNEMIQDAIQAFNTTVDDKALKSWNAMMAARQEKNWKDFYNEAVTTLALSLAHLGPPLPIPQDQGSNLSEDIRMKLDTFLSQLKITSSDMILTGASGHEVQSPPVITVTLDSIPVEGLGFKGVLQDGTELFSALTDQNGQLTLSNFKIPFVANGTLVYVRLNPGMAIAGDSYISSKNFGLKKSPEQTFILKLSRPSFTLEYKATSASELKLPSDFTSDLHIKKFLKDSCFMQEAGAGQSPDLAISVQSQVSSYNYDATEEVGLKIIAQITVKSLKLTPPRDEQEQVSFEKRYEQKVKLPYGLFLWEADTKVRQAIKAAMTRM